MMKKLKPIYLSFIFVLILSCSENKINSTYDQDVLEATVDIEHYIISCINNRDLVKDRYTMELVKIIQDSGDNVEGIQVGFGMDEYDAEAKPYELTASIYNISADTLYGVLRIKVDIDENKVIGITLHDKN